MLLLLFLVIWADDTFAYLVGRTIGRNRLFPSISPKKTLEGSVAGLVGSLLVAWGFASLFWQTAELEKRYPVSRLGGVVGQIGDLAESALKRGARLEGLGVIVARVTVVCSTGWTACCSARRFCGSLWRSWIFGDDEEVYAFLGQRVPSGGSVCCRQEMRRTDSMLSPSAPGRTWSCLPSRSVNFAPKLVVVGGF